MSLRRALNEWLAWHGGESQFQDKDEKFSFYPADWSSAMTDSRHFSGDALEHYDEAIRRQVICRLAGRASEADAWKAIANALNGEFKLKRP